MSTPLNDDELAELDAFLLSEFCDDESLSVDEAHGLLCAVVAGPGEHPWAELESQIWGEPNFPDAAVEARLRELLSRMHAEIADTLASGRNLEPLAVEVEDDAGETEGVAYEGWCYGFILGASLDQSAWDELPKPQLELFSPIAKLALLNDEESDEMEDDEYEQWVELLPGAVSGLYGYFHG